MARRYDSRTTIFSPEGKYREEKAMPQWRSSTMIIIIGRLYQVEYAMEAISQAGIALGILAKDGIVIAAEKKVTSKLLENDISSEKIYKLNE